MWRRPHWCQAGYSLNLADWTSCSFWVFDEKFLIWFINEFNQAAHTVDSFRRVVGPIRHQREPLFLAERSSPRVALVPWHRLGQCRSRLELQFLRISQDLRRIIRVYPVWKSGNREWRRFFRNVSCVGVLQILLPHQHGSSLDGPEAWSKACSLANDRA